MVSAINMSKSALFEMTMAGLEAYAVKHEGKHVIAVETFAHLWGRVNKSMPFKSHIEHVSIETSAKRGRGQVIGESLSLLLKKDLAKVFDRDDGYQYLGTFHTHPYVSNELTAGAREIRSRRLYNLSGGDHQSEFGQCAVDVKGRSFSTALVMTIFQAEVANDRADGKIASDLYEFSLGNLKVWLKGQVFEHIPLSELKEDDRASFGLYGLDISDYDEKEVVAFPVETELVCEFLDDFGTFLQGFGRLFATNRRADYFEREVAEGRTLYK